MKKRIAVTVPLMLGILLVFVMSVSGLETDRKKEGRQQLEEVLRRTAVTCYAAEGFYPPDLEYMREQYGLRYNENEYVIYYERFASNLMPVITVLEK